MEIILQAKRKKAEDGHEMGEETKEAQLLPFITQDHGDIEEHSIKPLWTQPSTKPSILGPVNPTS